MNYVEEEPVSVIPEESEDRGEDDASSPSASDPLNNSKCQKTDTDQAGTVPFPFRNFPSPFYFEPLTILPEKCFLELFNVYFGRVKKMTTKFLWYL